MLTLLLSKRFDSCFGFQLSLLIGLMVWICPTASAQQDPTPDPKPPVIEAASSEGTDAIAQFKYPQGLVCELFAAEPNVANIVSLHRDHQGRMFACETFRQERGVEDNRKHGHWMDEELAAQTVQDRIDYIKKYIPDAATSYTEQDDRIRLLIDSNDDGVADRVSVFSDKYNAVEMGTGAGVLSYRGNVYYTCIPSLFMLRDLNNDGRADAQLILQTGYGVRFAFRGHDMHGLIVGPDGRLYFSIGDRGYNVSDQVKDPTSGAVFRCDLDGNNLEVVATGLRNPQELAFDDFGNLFTGDNNSDSGDKARFTEIIEGADSGWRMHYQYIGDRGPFNREKIWYPFNEDTPAYILPPIANISDGPSGLEFYPGTGFGDRFANRFFLCDFRGSATVSGVRSFRHVPNGAGWKLADEAEQPFWNMLITDIDFGSDGKLYAADWVQGWQGANKGRIYAFHDPQHVDSPIVNEVEQVLKNGMAATDLKSLLDFLGHKDRRVRMEAQFELVKRRRGFMLIQTAQSTELSTLARVHALFGLEQIARLKQNQFAEVMLETVNRLLNDEDDQVVIAACKLLATLNPKAETKLSDLLKHQNARVRFQAAMTLHKIGKSKDVDAIAAMLNAASDSDPTLRHGGIMALVGIFEREPSPPTSTVAKLIDNDSAAVRRALCVAMRKVIASNRPNTFRAKQAAEKLVGQLLGDSDSSIVLEAARVVHDVPARSQIKTLAGLVDRIDSFVESDALVRRILNANFRVGNQAAAAALATYAATPGGDVERRAEVINWLSQWKNPPERDFVLHNWRPLNPKQRNLLDARTALQSNFDQLMDAEDSIAATAILAAGDLQLTSIGDGLSKVVLSPSATSSSRVAALKSLQRFKFAELDVILEQLADESEAKLPGDLKVALIDVMAKSKSEPVLIPIINSIFEEGTLQEKQSVIATMGTMAGAVSESRLLRFIEQMQQGKFDAALRLDVVNAALARSTEKLDGAVEKYRAATVDPKILTTKYLDALKGGSRSNGRKIFRAKTEVSCVRCHRVNGNGGEVGPDLSDIGKKKDRRYLLESIIEPNKVVAEGFAQTKVLTADGRLIVGLVKKETDAEMILLDAEGKEIVIEQDNIEDTMVGDSSMPADLHEKMTTSEIRDLVEFLASQKNAIKKDATEHE
ncbi:MAG: PVC-type heme-binding CxxCH protein [Planctomycetota bacterium]